MNMADAPPPNPKRESIVQKSQPQIPAPSSSQIPDLSQEASVAAIPPSADFPPAARPMLKSESPSLKKRQGRDEASLVDGTGQNLVAKRVRPEQAPAKDLPLLYENCDVEDMVIIISDMIQELIERNDKLPLQQGVLTRFHSRTPPGISVRDYLQRLAKHATLTPPLLLSMVYYMDRLCSLYPAFTVTTLTVHRFLITAATVAAKGLSDSFWNNTTYAKVGGIKIAELGMLELDFLYRVDWKIVPNPEVLVDYYRGLIERSTEYKLESDDGTSEDEDEEDVVESPEIKTEAATNEKWNKWMDDVSAQNTVKEGESVDKVKEEV